MAEGLRGKRVAIYARFSSSKQREASIDDQIRRCRDYVVQNGGAVADDLVFTDYAVSGSSMARAGFEAMIARVDRKPRTLDVIVAEDLSRITRDLADGADLFRKLKYAGIPLIGVADGIDTSAKNAKVSFTVKNLVADIYLDDLRDKTLRGLEGRHNAGYSTGNLPYGYRSVQETDARGGVVGHRIEINPEPATVVRRIFGLYLQGQSLATIAKTLCAECVPPPRARTQHVHKGWCDSTIRVFLHNEKYAGIWRYKEREWVKVPGENRRAPKLRDEGDVLESKRPELRIVDADVWEAVKARLDAVHARYTRDESGKTKGMAAPTKGAYLLSGLLVCGSCGGPMVIYGGGQGSGSRQYRCSHQYRRGTCQNKLSVREEVARTKIVTALREKLLSPAGLAYARKRIAERLGEMSRTANADIKSLRDRVARTEQRLARLVQFLADGNSSDSVASALKDLEVQAKADKAAISEIEHRSFEPIRLPSPNEVIKLVFDLDRVLAGDPLAGREALRQLLKDGHIRLEPQEDGVYLARTEILPLVLLGEAEKGNGRRQMPAAIYCQGSGGKI